MDNNVFSLDMPLFTHIDYYLPFTHHDIVRVTYNNLVEYIRNNGLENIRKFPTFDSLPYVYNHLNRNVLMSCIACFRSDIFKALAETKIFDMSICDVHGYDVLLIAAHFHNMDVVEYILDSNMVTPVIHLPTNLTLFAVFRDNINWLKIASAPKYRLKFWHPNTLAYSIYFGNHQSILFIIKLMQKYPMYDFCQQCSNILNTHLSVTTLMLMSNIFNNYILYKDRHHNVNIKKFISNVNEMIPHMDKVTSYRYKYAIHYIPKVLFTDQCIRTSLRVCIKRYIYNPYLHKHI